MLLDATPSRISPSQTVQLYSLSIYLSVYLFSAVLLVLQRMPAGL